jgi:hypothetical protein
VFRLPEKTPPVNEPGRRRRAGAPQQRAARPPCLDETFAGKPVRSIDRSHRRRISGTLLEQHPRALQLNGQRRQRVRQHIMDFARDASSLRSSRIRRTDAVAMYANARPTP